MGKSKANMLEAFRASASEPAREPRPARKAPPTRGAGGPFAPRLESAGAAVRARGTAQRKLQLGGWAVPGLAVAALGLVLAAFLAGRASVGGVVEAARPASGAPASVDPYAELAEGPVVGPEASSEVQEAALSPAEEAFLDPRNRFTVRVLVYNDPERDRELAFRVYEDLLAKGFEVVRPYQSGGKLYVFVGAAATTADLKATETRLQKTPGPGEGEHAYRTAFIVRIADYP